MTYNHFLIVYEYLQFQDDDFPGLPRDPLSVPNFQSLSLHQADHEDIISTELANPQCFLPAGSTKQALYKSMYTLLLIYFHLTFLRALMRK